jgi:hypothetical protein
MLLLMLNALALVDVTAPAAVATIARRLNFIVVIHNLWHT